MHEAGRQRSSGWGGSVVPLALLLSAVGVFGAAIPAGTDLGTREGTQWFPALEWTLENPSWEGNAFDVVATVEFRHTGSGERHRTEMFYAGGTTWAFRFSGTREGRWAFFTFSDDADLDGKTGRVVVSANPDPSAHGFLRQFGNKWGWEGTERAFVPQLAMWDYVMGSNSPEVFYGRPDLVEGRVEEFMGRHGFGGFHLPVVGGRWFDIGAGTDRVEAAMVEPDRRTFEALELLITRTHRAGGMVHLWPWGDHSREQTPRSLIGGLGGVIDQRLERYIAARLGPLPGWSMGYGFDLDEWVSADQLRAWHDRMHERMGWFHFLGGRPAGPNRGLDHTANIEWNRGLDYSSYEHHRPTYDVYRAALIGSAQRPVLSEDRFRIRRSQYADKDYGPDLVRRGLYESTLAGGVGNIWGIDPELAPGGRFPNRDELKTYALFFHGQGRFLADMVPANHLSQDPATRVLLSPGAGSLVVWREEADKLRLDLSGLKGPLPAVAVDTREAYREIQLGVLESAAQTLRLPLRSDWVVAIGRFELP